MASEIDENDDLLETDDYYAWLGLSKDVSWCMYSASNAVCNGMFCEFDVTLLHVSRVIILAARLQRSTAGMKQAAQ
jgi:hypothetical protein